MSKETKHRYKIIKCHICELYHGQQKAISTDINKNLQYQII